MKKAKDRVDWAMQEFTEACTASGVRHRLLREVGGPFSLMIDHARYHDLMIFGLRSLFEFDLVPDPHDALVRLVKAGVRQLLAVSKGFYVAEWGADLIVMGNSARSLLLRRIFGETALHVIRDADRPLFLAQ